MWMFPRVQAALFIVLVFAGCVRVGEEPPEESMDPAWDGWSERALTTGEGHDHANFAQHLGVTTPNFETLGYSPLISPSRGTTAAGHLCGDADETRDGRRIAAIESRSDVGFTLVDITDPTAPTFIGELVMQSTYVYDLAVVPDGRHIVLITQPVAPAAPAAPLPEPFRMEWHSPCNDGPVPLRFQAEDPRPRPPSLLLVDITDSEQPTVIDERPIAGNPHSVDSVILDGRTWVAASVHNAQQGLGNYNFYEILQTAAGPRLNLMSVWTMTFGTDVSEFTRELGHDDAWIVKHPKTGQTLVWIAHWHSGVFILDLSDPRNPEQIGHWTDYDPSKPAGDSGQIHSLFVIPELWEGRHFTLAGPEHPAKPGSFPTGIVWVLETTDPTRPFPVGAWTFPHDVEWSGRLQYSLHYMSVVNRTAFVSAYHAGVWALDVAPVLNNAFTLLPSVGVYFPDRESPKPPETPFRWTPTVEEALAMPDGTLVTFDSNSGLYTFRFDASRPMTPPVPWPISPPG